MIAKILERLRKNPGEFVSGEAISHENGISRAAVWKAVRALRKSGYVIASSTNKGYMLETPQDIYNKTEISDGLQTRFIGHNLIFFSSLDSTNNYAKISAIENCPDGTVVVAVSQTKGRGRLGRTWESTDEKGIWMSVVLRPSLRPGDIQLITLMAAVAVTEAVRSVAGVEAGLKWPNDLMIGEKKVCGILTEMNSETDMINYCVVGIGINVSQAEEDFTEEIRQTATSIEYGGNTGHISRKALIQEVLLSFEKYYDELCDGNKKLIIDKWSEYSNTIGRKISAVSGDQRVSGTALGIDSEGQLILQSDTGAITKIFSGEILI